MKHLFGISMLFLALSPLASASSLVATDERSFALGEDGKIYQRMNCDSVGDINCNFRSLPTDQLPNGLRAVDISVLQFRVPRLARNAYILSVVANDGTIYESGVLHDGDALSLNRAPIQLPDGIKVYTGRPALTLTSPAPSVVAPAPRAVAPLPRAVAPAPSAVVPAPSNSGRPSRFN